MADSRVIIKATDISQKFQIGDEEVTPIKHASFEDYGWLELGRILTHRQPGSCITCLEEGRARE